MIEVPEATKSTKTMSSYEEAQELLYMFYYSSGNEKEEVYETLLRHLKNEHMVESSNLIANVVQQSVTEAVEIVTLEEEVEKLQSWLRFFTSNSTRVEELFEMIDPAYNEGVRREVCQEVADYFNEKDK